MNRTERRQKGSKERPKTYTLTLEQITRMKQEAADEAYNRIMAAMEQEISRQVLEADRQYSTDLDAALLWTLHLQLGFGRQRLRKFWEAFLAEHEFLRAVYGNGEPTAAKFREYLAGIGVDIEAWKEEEHNNAEQY